MLIVWDVRLFYVFIVLPEYVEKSKYNVFTSLTVLTHLRGDLSVWPRGVSWGLLASSYFFFYYYYSL